MASGSYDRADFYRRNRDYSRLLGGSNLEEKEEKQEVEEADFDSRPSRRSAADEDAKTTRERQEYIQRRQKLKELERLKLKEKYTGIYGRKTESLKNESGNQNSRNGENNKRKCLPNDNFGSFFGPTQPVIARRVMEETRAKLETAHFSAKVSKEAPEPKKSSTAAAKSSRTAAKSSTAAANTKAVFKKKPVAINEAMKKAQQLKAARDYSFLFSDDIENPAPERQQASESRNAASSRPKNCQPKQVVMKNSMEIKKAPLSKSILEIKKAPLSKSISHATQFKSMGSSSRQMPTKGDPQKSLVDSKKQIRKIVSGGRLANENGSIHHSASNAKMDARGCSDKKRPPSNPGPKDVKVERQQPLVKHKHQQSSARHPTSVQKILPSNAPTQRSQAEQRKPVASHKSMPPKPLTKLAPKPVPKLTPKPAPKLAPKLAPKPSPKHVPKSAPKPQARPLSHDLHHDRPKKRSRGYISDEDMDEGTNYRSLIRQMFRYDPNKYRDDDEDDSDMEVGFSRIQEEERRSARIAREEDERELALIEEEEREERARAKKRKLKQSQR
ncbi:hypothetical protein SUGI_0749720 [Cryptomeria japonica]|uniref:protein spt2 n=1 Tax=Cryptomeria japonica TaxID=3369 RepID=UPI0024147960|nr:protein spt2 [Cryptomeria japonica]XP_057818110.2 protein spt2 [Cryptomeria japonica]XP_057818111.2 protein spt2 [Cryptomeria japonica]XP_057818112.2 protein spt2 [Cryptomeria japonica]XP_059065383.1 protein spt2 [Cryptomeria japonica]GLJ37004.1 hypothetical protein SUGI_0749720 [Cryptomeria japonica]